MKVEGYELVPLRYKDMSKIKDWRNAQLAVLRQKKPLTDDEQERYWHEVIVPSQTENQPRQILYSILRNGNLIGYGGLVHIDWEARRGEISFLLDPSYKDMDEAFKFFLKKIIHIAFCKNKFHKLTTETYDIRPRVVSLLEGEGFVLEGRLKDHVIVDGQYVDSLIHGLIASTPDLDTIRGSTSDV